MSDITEFLNARRDERAAKARAAMHRSEGRWSQVDPDREPGRIEDDRGEPVSYYEGRPTEAQADHMVANDPAHVLREVEGERLIIDWVDETYGPDYLLYALALRDADHPDYRGEWKP